jgi:hypothetical protein
MLTQSDKTRLANEAWENILQGDVADAIPKLDLVILADASIGSYNNRGIARLLLGQLDFAMEDFLCARHFSPANRTALFVGIPHWMAGRKDYAHRKSSIAIGSMSLTA